jgi:hypothetical protein
VLREASHACASDPVNERRMVYQSSALAMEKVLDKESVAKGRERQARRWSFLNELDASLLNASKVVACGVCGSLGQVDKLEVFQATDMFGAGGLTRYRCPVCGVVFGPEKVLALPLSVLFRDYEDLYLSYKEGPTADVEVAVVQKILSDWLPIRPRHVLNFGAGVGSGLKKIHETPKFADLEVIGYDPVYSDLPLRLTNRWNDIVSGPRFDAIFSNNVIEHFQAPVEQMRKLRELLQPLHTSVIYMATPRPEVCLEKYAHTRFHTFFYLNQSLHVLAERVGGLEFLGMKEFSKQEFLGSDHHCLLAFRWKVQDGDFV